MATSNVTRRETPYTPFTTSALSREVQEFRNRARQLFEEPLPRWMREGIAPGVAHVVDWYPAAEVAEGPEDFTVTIELPGMKSKDVSVDFDEGVLTVSGEKTSERERREEKEEKEAKEGKEARGDARKYHVWERSYGSFQRSFAFPAGVDADKIRAELKDGVLNVRVPKRAEAIERGRRITVKEG